MFTPRICAFVGPTEFLIPPQQHNEHCKGWRWEMYLADSKKRQANVMEAARQIIAQRRAAEDLAESYRTPFTAEDQAGWEHERARAIQAAE